MTPDPKALKRELRAQALAASAGLTPAERQARSDVIAGRLAVLERFHAATTVALYAPLATEVDTGPIARAVLARGGRLAYPRTLPGSRRLAFCACRPDQLRRGPLGAGEPPPDAPELPLDQLPFLLVPGVAFSRGGLRLGRGGGHYDATLALAPGAFRVGLAFDLQLRPDLPAEPHDLALDAIVTERETLTFQRPVTT